MAMLEIKYVTPRQTGYAKYRALVVIGEVSVILMVSGSRIATQSSPRSGNIDVSVRIC